MMSKPFFTRYLSMSMLLILAVLTAACSAAESPMAAAPMTTQPAIAAEDAAAEAPAEAEPASAVDDTGRVTSQLEAVANTPNVYNRLIIKNAELELMVADTDTAINRSLGLATEYGGYVVSNRTWFSGEEKYATMSLGVPTENFEEMLRRLKDLGNRVTNETVSGQDVTDEFVDLESRLKNLETTAARIRNFMEQAETVQESLQVSAQLSQIEAEIEQVKGRMNYLKDRATFSTITLQITPETPDPIVVEAKPWAITHSVERALNITSRLANGLYRIGVELIVFVTIVLLPFVLPLVGLVWLGIKIFRRIGAGNVRV